jgi:hypothetical protein
MGKFIATALTSLAVCLSGCAERVPTRFDTERYEAFVRSASPGHSGAQIIAENRAFQENIQDYGATWQCAYRVYDFSIADQAPVQSWPGAESEPNLNAYLALEWLAGATGFCGAKPEYISRALELASTGAPRAVEYRRFGGGAGPQVGSASTWHVIVLDAENGRLYAFFHSTPDIG